MLGTADEHRAKLEQLEALGVSHFALYLMHHAQEQTLTAYGEHVLPAFAARSRP